MSDEPDGDTSAITGQALVARELRRYRERAGLSRNQLATRVGYSRTYISTCEKPGASLVSEAVVSRIDQELRAGGTLVRLQAQAAAEQRSRRGVDAGHPRPDRASASVSGDGLGSSTLSGGRTRGPGEVHAVVPAIRRAMQEVAFAPVSIPEPMTPAHLDLRVAQAWNLWHSSPARYCPT